MHDLATVERTAVPLALAHLHREHAAGSVAEIRLGDHWSDEARANLWEGGGWEPTAADTGRVERRLTLPDTIAADMTVLVCGLNPSVFAAEAGVGFARPGNRFWPAALTAGLVTEDRDPFAALRDHGVGMTDLVKRATRRSEEIDTAEFQRGLQRLSWLVDWLEPRVVCVVGLTGWRAAGHDGAVAGQQDDALGGRPVYLMPNPSGLNAHTGPDDFVEHFRSVRTVADSGRAG